MSAKRYVCLLCLGTGGIPKCDEYCFPSKVEQVPCPSCVTKKFPAFVDVKTIEDATIEVIPGKRLTE